MELDDTGQRSLVRHCIEGGAHGIACLLLAGEVYKLTDEERKRVASVVVDENNGRVPVLVGISHSGTIPSVEMARHASDIGADGVIAAPPFHSSFLKEASYSLLSHYSRIARSTDLPMVIQDYETKDGIHLSVDDLDDLTRKLGNVCCVKIEGLAHLDKIRLTHGRIGRRLAIFGGMAGRHIIEELELGSQGSMPGAEAVPALVKTYEAKKRGKADVAESNFREVRPYLDFLVEHFDSFVEIEKEVLKVTGVIADSAVRPPAIPLAKVELARLSRLVNATFTAPRAH